jgi:hypothetical protein
VEERRREEGWERTFSAGGFAPTVSLIFTPSLNAKNATPGNCSASFSKIGEMTRHGPHHVAQKSMTAGLSPLIYARTGESARDIGHGASGAHDSLEFLERGDRSHAHGSGGCDWGVEGSEGVMSE